MSKSGHLAKRIVLEGLGWLLVVGGIIAMPLPGPGLLILVGGVALLAQQYEWAARRLDPVKRRALIEAARGVSGPVPLAITLTGIAVLVAAGVVWFVQPDVPGWWPVRESWWLPGGIWTAVTQWLSAAIALGMLVYSWRRFHGDPDAVDALRSGPASRGRTSRVGD